MIDGMMMVLVCDMPISFTTDHQQIVSTLDPTLESDGSGSDYSATAREHKRRLQKSRNRDVVETDEEDIELDAEMEAEVDDDEMVAEHSSRTREHTGASSKVGTKPRFSREEKGKGRAVSRDMDDTTPAESAHTAGERRLKPGPLSDEAKTEIAEFSRVILETADALAQRHGKTRNDILSVAGLGHVKNSRVVNPANAYRKWYKVHRPKPEHGAFCDVVCWSTILILCA